MTFKNGVYVEYYKEKHREALYNEYGKIMVELSDKINEMINRINEQDKFLKEISEWADETTDYINSIILKLPC